MTDDILAGNSRRRPPAVSEHSAVPGLWVEHLGSGYVGVVEALEHGAVGLRDDSGLLRFFPLEPAAFRLVEEGRTVTLRPPQAPAPSGPRLTKAGAIAGDPAPARIASANRILVEGIHDAELLEKVWGDDLRAEAIVVEPLHGADDLAAEIAQRQPGPQRRLGVLLDHLVPGSKETRIAASITSPHVRIEGHPYVDIWQAVRPSVLGLTAWPVIPHGQAWKVGITDALGGDDPALLWRQILRRVDSYRDLEPALVGAVERLLDFLCSPAD